MMPRLGRPQRERRGAPCDAAVWEWLMMGQRPADNFELFMLDGQGDQPNSALRRLWADLGDVVIATYVQAHSGKRPPAWWRLQAPEMRRRLGGRGTLRSELMADVPTFQCGLPTNWLADDWGWTWNGGTPPVGYIPFDRSDPPTFESQASYLKRLGLFLPSEASRVRAADYRPEAVELEDDDGD